MAPSRGVTRSSSSAEESDDVAIRQQGDSALIKASRNFNYLIAPKSSDHRPARLRTRALLRTVRYIGQFIVWRLVRWAKYAAVGALVAAVGATAFGGMVSGIAWVAAPPTITASIVMGCAWGVGKYFARKLHARWKSHGMDEGERLREHKSDHPVKRESTLRQEVEPEALPW